MGKLIPLLWKAEVVWWAKDKKERNSKKTKSNLNSRKYEAGSSWPFLFARIPLSYLLIKTRHVTFKICLIHDATSLRDPLLWRIPSEIFNIHLYCPLLTSCGCDRFLEVNQNPSVQGVWSNKKGHPFYKQERSACSALFSSSSLVNSILATSFSICWKSSIEWKITV